jgi:hypothetical protein
MMKGYSRISQCSPKGGMISDRVRHSFIIPGVVVSSFSRLLLGLLPKQSFCLVCLCSQSRVLVGNFSFPLLQHSLPSTVDFLLEDSVVGGLTPRYFVFFLSEVVSGVIDMIFHLWYLPIRVLVEVFTSPPFSRAVSSFLLSSCGILWRFGIWWLIPQPSFSFSGKSPVDWLHGG